MSIAHFPDIEDRLAELLRQLEAIQGDMHEGLNRIHRIGELRSAGRRWRDTIGQIASDANKPRPIPAS